MSKHTPLQVVITDERQTIETYVRQLTQASAQGPLSIILSTEDERNQLFRFPTWISGVNLKTSLRDKSFLFNFF